MTRPHKYRPFTTRDGSKACSDCYGRPDSTEHRLGEVSDQFLEAVEEECGMGAGAWDTIDPREVILAVVKVASRNRAYTLTPEQVERARWLLDNVDVDVYEEISWIRISYKLLREVVGDE